MHMYESFLSSIPKNRSELVSELKIPEMTLSPYAWEPPECLTPQSDSLLSTATDELELRTFSTDSSIPLSRAMTDSEIDYERFRRYKNRSFSDPWNQMKTALDAFPPGHLDSLYRFQKSAADVECTLPTSTYERRPYYNAELRRRMERFFDEDCCVFPPGDPGLDTLKEAIRNVDMKIYKLKMERLYGADRYPRSTVEPLRRHLYPYYSYPLYPYSHPLYPYSYPSTLRSTLRRSHLWT